MKLLNTFSYYEGSNNKPIPYEVFQENGWKENDFFKYLSQLEVIRAAMIFCIKHFPCNNIINYGEKERKGMLKLSVEDLKEFLEQYTDEKLDFDALYRFLYAVPLSFIEYNWYSALRNEEGPDCSYLYKSLDDFRFDIEKLIYASLKGKEVELIIPDETLKHKMNIVKSLGYEGLVKKQKEFKDLLYEYELRDYALDMSSYTTIQRWARLESKKATSCEEIEEKYELLEDLIELYKRSNYDTNNILYVHGGDSIGCTTNKHNVVCVNAILPTLNENEPVKINVNYCFDCDKFFISKFEYEEYRKIYPNMLANVVFVDGDNKIPDDEVSILTLNGYSVRQDGPTSLQRQAILVSIIKSGIMQKHQIIYHLGSLIRRNRFNVKMDKAILKWQEDLKFIRNYNLDIQSTHKINEVKKHNER